MFITRASFDRIFIYLRWFTSIPHTQIRKDVSYVHGLIYVTEITWLEIIYEDNVIFHIQYFQYTLTYDQKLNKIWSLKIIIAKQIAAISIKAIY